MPSRYIPPPFFEINEANKECSSSLKQAKNEEETLTEWPDALISNEAKGIVVQQTQKAKAVVESTRAIVQLLLNGHCNFVDLIQYAFIMNWRNSYEYGTSIPKAVKTFLQRKSGLADLVVALRKGINKTLNNAKYQLPEFRMFMHHIEKWEEAINEMLLWMVNNEKIKADEMWRRVIIFHLINQWRFEEKEHRLRWGSADFHFVYRSKTAKSNEMARAEADCIKNEKNKEIQSTGGRQMRNKMTESGAKCWICDKPGHRKRDCPNRNKNGQNMNKRNKKRNQMNTGRWQQQQGQGSQNGLWNRSQGNQPHIPVQHLGIQQPFVMQQYPNMMYQTPNGMYMQPMMIQNQGGQMQMMQGAPPRKGGRGKNQQQGEGVGRKFYVQTDQGLKLRSEVRNHPKPCRFFRNDEGCRNEPEDCPFPHFCSQCYAVGHNDRECKTLPRNAWH